MLQPVNDPLLLRIRDSIRAEVDPDFDYIAAGEPPWAEPPVAMSAVRVALVTTAGLHRRGDAPFRTMDQPLGDTTFRIVSASTVADDLDLRATYVDQRHIPRDPEVALPLRALDALHRAGICGPPSPRHASFSGGIVRPFPGLEQSAAALFDLFSEDGAGAAILIPSCPLCVQTVSLVARELERRGLPTVCLSLVPELSRIVRPPRTLSVRFPFGAPCGDAGNSALHQAVLSEALSLLAEAAQPGVMRESRHGWRSTPKRE